ncbi:hypothetical protein LPJ53_002042 [Coemansia erecta]|uniref:RanBD1 domain-containing protein n=1 Tax=Coemansia erecta TaxID=147472 RepID=A0A9W7XYY9_9FUNG|nr:hypothetical protein LPJ53_002042 [Coemansia erecta]
MTEAETVETKRKRQDSIKGLETTAAAAASNDDLLIPTPQEAEEPSSAPPSPLPTASSPAKKPRVNLDDAAKVDDDQVSSSGSEAAADAAHSVEAIELTSEPQSVSVPAPAPAPVPTKVFGMGFGFASAAKKASPFAAYTSATSGFAKYAVKKDVAEESVTQTTVAAAAADGGEDNEEEKDCEKEEQQQVKVLSPQQATKTFEDMLATQGAETLESTAAPTTTLVEPTSPTEPVRTFEEDETCLFTTKGKLFELAGGNWKERGGGQFKINQHNDSKRRRMVMRTELTFRLILNAPLFAGMKAVCERRFVRFACFDADSKTPTTFALRFPNEAAAKSVFAAIEKNIPSDADGTQKTADDETAEQGADGASAASSRASSEEAASEHASGESDAADEEEAEEEAGSDHGDESEDDHADFAEPEDEASENEDEDD